MPGDLKDKYATSYKTCADKEVLQGSSNSGSNSGSSAAANWAQMDSMDVAGKDIASGGKAFTEVGGVWLLGCGEKGQSSGGRGHSG